MLSNKIMTSLITTIPLYLFALHVVTSSNSYKTEMTTICRERNRLIDTEKGDLYMLVDATFGENLILQCLFCNENDDAEPKIWYKIDNYGYSAPHEVDIDLNSNQKKNKVQVNSQHSLVLNNFTVNDTGLYYCLTLEQTNPEEKFNYLIDLIYNNDNQSIESGNFTAWSKYHEDYFQPVNRLLSTTLRQTLMNTTMELMTQWRPWGMCDVCGRPRNEGVRKKRGLCRIKLSTRQKPSETKNRSWTVDELFLLNANVISCRSILLSRTLPGVSNLTRIIPDFVQTQSCQGTCNPDAEGLAKGWKAKKSFGFKYRKRFVLNEGQHLTIVCPESTLENDIVWRRNGKVLKPGEQTHNHDDDDDARVIVDTFNTLYLIDVKASEEGNYTCQVDDIKMQQITVNVISKLMILSQVFLRYMIYLSIVLFLTLTCYCAGLVIACSRRHLFKSYDELVELRNYNEYEKLKGDYAEDAF